MLKQFESVRLTVVDFLGVFLPGGVWTILFLTAEKMMNESQYLVTLVTPVSVALSYAKGYDAAFYVGISMASLLFGYINMALSTKPAQFISNFFPSIFIYSAQKGCDLTQKKKTLKQIFEDNKFPYNDEFHNKKYFETIKNFVLSKTRHQWEDIFSPSSYQPFETCKRLLRLYAPVLSEETERREAQVRMLASLLLAAVFNFLLALTAMLSSMHIIFFKDYFPAYIERPTSEILFPWLITSIFITYLISVTFRMRRYREVEDVYLCTLIMCRLPENEGGDKSIIPGSVIVQVHGGGKLST